MFKRAMLDAIVKGHKTQTRRLKKKGEVGDRLWCKEGIDLVQGRLVYAYDGTIYQTVHNGKRILPMYMPKEAARFWLKITNVRVERLGGITEEDARAEGMIPNWVGPLDGWNPNEHGFLPIDHEKRYRDDDVVYCTALDAFMLSWEAIYGKGAWEKDKDTLIWVHEFRMI